MFDFSDLIIFEMANSHQGKFEHGIKIIREMSKISHKYNLKSAVKLQYRNLTSFIHPNFRGRNDIKHISRFEETKLDYKQYLGFVELIKEEEMITISTPFDEDGVEWCLDQGIDVIKVASCSAMDWPLLEVIAETKKPLIISTGGKSIQDIDKIYNFFTHRNCNFALLHCTSEYPANLEHIQLDFIDKLKRRYHNIKIGYSGHEEPNNNMVPMLAVAKGAEIFERHVGLPTENIKLNSYSMNPEQTEEWIKSILMAKCICNVKKENTKFISQEELDSLNSLMRGTYVKHKISKGDIINFKDVFFAMPCNAGQLTSGNFTDGIVASRNYETNEAFYEEKIVTDINLTRSVIHDAKGLIFEAGIALGNNFEVELSHHLGMKHFRQVGAIILSIINREYCKKLIIVLPSQKHPNHFHKQKEETFQLLFGDLDINIDGKLRSMKAGDIQTVFRGQAHSFSSKTGAIFEEISTTHIKGDSYYDDSRINVLDLMERKTIIHDW